MNIYHEFYKFLNLNMLTLIIIYYVIFLSLFFHSFNKHINNNFFLLNNNYRHFLLPLYILIIEDFI